MLKQSIKDLYNTMQHNKKVCRKEMKSFLSGFFYASLYLRKIHLFFNSDNDTLKSKMFSSLFQLCI